MVERVDLGAVGAERAREQFSRARSRSRAVDAAPAGPACREACSTCFQADQPGSDGCCAHSARRLRSCTSVPPSATLSIWIPRHMPRIGSPRASARGTSSSSKAVARRLGHREPRMRLLAVAAGLDVASRREHDAVDGVERVVDRLGHPRSGSRAGRRRARAAGAHRRRRSRRSRGSSPRCRSAAGRRSGAPPRQPTVAGWRSRTSASSISSVSSRSSIRSRVARGLDRVLVHRHVLRAGDDEVVELAEADRLADAVLRRALGARLVRDPDAAAAGAAAERVVAVARHLDERRSRAPRGSRAARRSRRCGGRGSRGRGR